MSAKATILVGDLGDGRYVCHGQVYPSLDTVKADVGPHWPTAELLVRPLTANEAGLWKHAARPSKDAKEIVQTVLATLEERLGYRIARDAPSHRAFISDAEGRVEAILRR